ncbi:hypothetical protein [Paenibacillus glycanilyticus]|uniref:hypothetical protein n=1 Tax=Paenibacillus glycanilyticus TaxID=126569 RepID=UPI000FD76A53|nr:hypothetical protein [Paenibacillus glycanilyticus]
MYSSLKGLTSGGGTSSIKRSFPVAPGETIEKDDVVTIFDNMLYRNAEMPVDGLPRFSPDVLYLNSEEYSNSIHPIGGNSYLYIGTTQKVISIYRVELEASRMSVSVVKKLPIYGVEGINQFQFKPLSEDMGILCYLESNTSIWTMLTIRWNDSGLQLGESSRMELYSGGSLPAIESLSDNKFLLVWHCTKVAPWRLKASVCHIGLNDLITLEGYATEIDSAANLYAEFAFSKLSVGMFAASYWVKESDTKGSLATKMVTWNGERLALGEKTVIPTAGSWQSEVKHLVLSSVHFILSLKLDTTLTFHPITLREAANIPVNGGPTTGNLADSFYDAVKISEKRFVTAVCYKESGALVLNLFETTDGNIKQIAGKAVLTSVKGSSNKLTLTAIGQSLFVLAFNHEPERDYAYTQALMFKMAPDQNVIDDLNWKEQLTTIWSRDAAAYGFIFCPTAASGFIAAGQGRLKLFRCGWSPTRFISSGVGEFNRVTGDHDRIWRTVASVVLSNGYVVIAYRERDTWHGKLSVLEPFEGSYKPIQSHTFSYSHVDNLSIVELTPGVIALQYKQRINPSYDSKQLNSDNTFEELKLLTGSVSSTGLSGKITTGFKPEEAYINSQIVKLDNGYLLHVGVTSNYVVTARVIRCVINDTSVTFTPLDQVEYLDYQRMNASAIRIGPNLAAIQTDSKMIVVEVGENGLLCKLADHYFQLQDRTTRGIIADGRGGFIQVTTHNINQELLELTPYRFGNDKLFQYADTRSVNKTTLDVQVEVGADGKAALFYQARWQSGRSSTLAEPHQNLVLGLLDMNAGSNPEDRHYPFPCSEGTLPVFLPLDSQRYFCMGTDPDGNQIYMTAYSNGEQLTYGKPCLTPQGIAGSNGASGEYVEVAIRGIAEVEVPLRAGSTYYYGRDGKLSLYPNGSKVGLAISGYELLLE